MRTLAGLLDFECAARWGSFKLAAQELHKTPAAVSQQIRQLEGELGFALFVRHPRHVAITDKGRDLAATLSRVLAEVDAKIARLRESDDDLILRVSTTHSFAMKWLVPRLRDFSLAHPDLDLRLESSDRLAVLDDGSCDVAVRYGRGDGPVLYRERLVVVHSPDLVAGGRLTLADLAACPLLYEGTPEAWMRLLLREGVPSGSHVFSRGYSHAGPLVQAAVAGHGVALAPFAIAAEDIRAGRLRLLPCAPVVSPYGYRLETAPGRAATAKVRLFADWLARGFAETLAALAASLPVGMDDA